VEATRRETRTTHLYGSGRAFCHRSSGFAVLHQSIRPPIGTCCARDHQGYQPAHILISGQVSEGPTGGDQLRRRRQDPPFHARAHLGRETASQPLSPDRLVRAVRPFLRPAHGAGHCAQGPSRLTGTVAFVPAPAVCRPWRSPARCRAGESDPHEFVSRRGAARALVQFLSCDWRSRRGCKVVGGT
jgi:hypothetical protein